MKIVDTEVIFMTADEAGTNADVNVVLCTMDDQSERALVNVDAAYPDLARDVAAYLKGGVIQTQEGNS